MSGYKFFYTPTEGDCLAHVNDAYIRIKTEVEVNPNIKIDLFGFSRGAADAIALANKLKQDKIKVRFLGLVDPSLPGDWMEGRKLIDLWEPGVPKTVDQCTLGVREKNRGWITDPYRKLENIDNVIMLDVKHPEAGFNRTIGSGLFDDAKAAGVPLVGSDPFKDPEWQDFPHGGVMRFPQEYGKWTGGQPFPWP